VNLTDPSILAAVHQRATQRYASAQADFHLFLKTCVFTQDEARSRVAQMPDWPFIGEVADAFAGCPLLFVEKSRRTLGSWLGCAWDLFIASGGVDRRWPTLLNGTTNRKVVIAAKKLQDAQGSAMFLGERVKFIYDEFERRGCREFWPTFPTWKFTHSEARGSNGSVIYAVPSGQDQLRGVTATLLHMEEVAFWDNAQASIEAALPVLRGGGHIICISTANAGSYARKIVMGEIGKGHWNE
jgi:hypothetical protein